jgi:hypothetical protein
MKTNLLYVVFLSPMISALPTVQCGFVPQLSKSLENHTVSLTLEMIEQLKHLVRKGNVPYKPLMKICRCLSHFVKLQL